MATDISSSALRYLHPRFWSVWCLLGVIYLVAQIPQRPGMKLGRWLGRVGFHIARHRRQIADINLSICFPLKNDAARRGLLLQHFESLGMALVEVAYCWCLPASQLKARLHGIVGEAYLQEALDKGHGVILMAGHFTHLEMGATLLGLCSPTVAVYRPHKNPLLEAFIQRGRARHNVGGRLIPKNQPRAMLRALRNNYSLWYSADQDYQGGGMVFAPFFGLPAATNAAIVRLARLSEAPVLPVYQERLANDQGYRLHVMPPLDAFPGGTVTDDMVRVNRLLESLVQRQPADYLWVHRRFKTRPPGEHPIYDMVRK